MPGEEFEVSEIIRTESAQCYLRLQDGRGWAFTHSAKDNRCIAQDVLRGFLSDERERRLREEQVAVEVAKRLVAEAEEFPEDAEKLRRSRAALDIAKMATTKVQAMTDNPDGFVREVLQAHARLDCGRCRLRP
eukprot:gnl/TRDRNA2_/TRDRNA2_79181_c0_seq1.p1 gnl/TRDRNA2_/TRDRNA2_79181_c0~~gnl/TRDRNA2_/TRDRNA2_79181_c0_seq1.p1  ORF type:complete len:140 (+),score=31.97 gnl/TRDRNA2_/TRDRNA2_79181_c0_seq1:24-422(+)